MTAESGVKQIYGQVSTLAYLRCSPDVSFIASSRGNCMCFCYMVDMKEVKVIWSNGLAFNLLDFMDIL